MAVMFSKTNIAIIFAVVIGALCVTLYEAWLDPFQALVVLVVIVGGVVGLVVKGKEGN